jgi:hypothetical protein
LTKIQKYCIIFTDTEAVLCTAAFSRYSERKNEMAIINIAGRLNLQEPLVPQVEQALSLVGLALQEADAVWLSGQPTAAIVGVALLEGVGSSSGDFKLPTIIIHGGGAEATIEKGVFDLHVWRHNRVRSQRNQVSEETGAAPRIVVLDGMGFGMPTTVRSALAAQVDVPPEAIEVFNIRLGQADYGHPEAGVLEKLLELPDYCYSSDTRLILLPEGWAPRAVITEVACYGLRHLWPEVLRVLSLGPGKVEYKELIDVHELRQNGAALVTAWKAQRTAELLDEVVAVAGPRFSRDGHTLVVELPGGRRLKLVVAGAEMEA